MAEEFDHWMPNGQPSLHLGATGGFDHWTSDGRPLLQLAAVSPAAVVGYLMPVIIND